MRKEFLPQHDVGFVIQYNQRVVFFFFSVLEENRGGYPTTESEITLQTQGQTVRELHPATARKAADQRLTA